MYVCVCVFRCVQVCVVRGTVLVRTCSTHVCVVHMYLSCTCGTLRSTTGSTSTSTVVQVYRYTGVRTHTYYMYILYTHVPWYCTTRYPGRPTICNVRIVQIHGTVYMSCTHIRTYIHTTYIHVYVMY